MQRKGVSNAEAFAGFCRGCGHEMRKPRMNRAGIEHGWLLMQGRGLCSKCYWVERRGDQGGKDRREGHSPTCLGCSRILRYQGEPIGVGERRRHAKDLCSTCYRKAMAADVVGQGVHVNCTVCLRVFGSRGVYGGTVSLGTKSTGVCTTCRDRNVQRRKRGEQEDGPG